MDVHDAIARRRAYRSLAPVTITEELIRDMVHHASLAPSCFNNQPWRFAFVWDEEMRRRMHDALSRGNEWAQNASMFIVVYSRKEDDCVIHEREYHLFDTGMATAFLILRATELGLVAHPIAGYSPRKVRELLHLPEESTVIALVIVGKHSHELSPVLSEKQRKDEMKRPQRKPFEEIASLHPPPPRHR